MLVQLLPLPHVLKQLAVAHLNGLIVETVETAVELEDLEGHMASCQENVHWEERASALSHLANLHCVKVALSERYDIPEN